ncbi:hypothetical protein ACFL5K_04235 [Gemmatimonadota bacterium]
MPNRINPSLISLLLLILIVFSACEQTENRDNERLVFSVEAGTAEFPVNSGPLVPPSVKILTDGGAVSVSSDNDLASDSSFTPVELRITITLPAELVETLLNPNGYRVMTQIELAEGDIIINHTNQAYTVLSPDSDTLYAVHGEGIVSSGTGIFKNISGLFYELSTYEISDTTAGGGDLVVESMNCRYELLVDF